MPELDVSAPIGRIVSDNPLRASVLSRRGIDASQESALTLEAGCLRKGLDPGLVLEELRDADQAAGDSAGQDWEGLTLTELVEHIEQTHHAYLAQALPRILQLADRAVEVCGSLRPEILDVREELQRLASDLQAHARTEETVVFPACRALDRGRLPAGELPISIRNPVFVVDMDHDRASAAMARMRSLTHGFRAPAGACNTCLELMVALIELDRDLLAHFHKESAILFPRAVRREAELREAVPPAVNQPAD